MTEWYIPAGCALLFVGVLLLTLGVFSARMQQNDREYERQKLRDVWQHEQARTQDEWQKKRALIQDFVRPDEQKKALVDEFAKIKLTMQKLADGPHPGTPSEEEKRAAFKLAMEEMRQQLEEAARLANGGEIPAG